jgi:hypothetical protein
MFKSTRRLVNGQTLYSSSMLDIQTTQRDANFDNLLNSHPDRYTGSDDFARARPGHFVKIVGQPMIVPVTFSDQ